MSQKKEDRPDWLVELSQPTALQQMVAEEMRRAVSTTPSSKAKAPEQVFLTWLALWITDKFWGNISDREVMDAAVAYFEPRGQYITKRMIAKARGSGGPRRRGRKPKRR